VGARGLSIALNTRLAPVLYAICRRKKMQLAELQAIQLAGAML
jgi:hypothetical protein